MSRNARLVRIEQFAARRSRGVHGGGMPDFGDAEGHYPDRGQQQNGDEREQDLRVSYPADTTVDRVHDINRRGPEQRAS
jgi:hypothetical protein